METTLTQQPFDEILDSYHDKALEWAQEVWPFLNKSYESEIPEAMDKISGHLYSIAFADIFNKFIHYTLRYPLGDTELYIEGNLSSYGDTEELSQTVLRLEKLIYKSLLEKLGDNYNIFGTLKDKVCIPDEDEPGAFINPLSDTDELKGMDFVSNKFNY